MTTEQTIDLRDAARAGLFESYRRDGAEAWFTTQGTSMLPLIRPGSRVLVEFGARPAIGEVVLFPYRDRYVAHRVIGRRRESSSDLLLVKGDAEAYPDRPLKHTDILGVVRMVQRRGAEQPRQAGLGGRSGRLLATTSSWSGRTARIGRRLVTRGPRMFRPAGLRIVATFARVPTRLATAPLTRFGAERR